MPVMTASKATNPPTKGTLPSSASTNNAATALPMRQALRSSMSARHRTRPHCPSAIPLAAYPTISNAPYNRMASSAIGMPTIEISRISTATGMHTSATNPHSRLHPNRVRQTSPARRDDAGIAATSAAANAISPRVQNQPGPSQRERSRRPSRAPAPALADAERPGSASRCTPPATCAAGSSTISSPLR
jgi:hypothetical protein